MRVCMSENEISEIKINMAELNSDVKYIKESLGKHIDKEEKHLEAFNQAIDRFFNDADKKYAPIITWNVILWTARIVGGAVVLAVVGLIGKAILHLY